MRCKRCGSEEITLTTVVEARKTGCIEVLIYLLIACTILGLFIVIPILLMPNKETKTYAVCNKCGKRWLVV